MEHQHAATFKLFLPSRLTKFLNIQCTLTGHTYTHAASDGWAVSELSKIYSSSLTWLQGADWQIALCDRMRPCGCQNLWSFPFYPKASISGTKKCRKQVLHQHYQLSWTGSWRKKNTWRVKAPRFFTNANTHKREKNRNSLIIHKEGSHFLPSLKLT